MGESAFSVSIEEFNYLVIAGIVSGAAFTAWSGSLNINSAFLYTGSAFLALLLREFGQRMIAQWQHGKVNLSLSAEGSMTTVFGSMIAVVTGLPFLVVFPVTSSFDMESYEQWGKHIDAMWSKRATWVVYGGIFSLLTGSFLAGQLGLPVVSDVLAIFTAFQLLPFDYKNIPTGTLDGAYIMKQNCPYWLLLMSTALLLALL